MRIDDRQPNQLTAALEAGETLHFAMRYLRGREFGIPLLPPCPFGSPLIRLYHGCYWLGRHRAAAGGGQVSLTGPTVVGRFRAVALAAGEHCFINCRHLAAFSFAKGGGLHTQLSRVISPTMWALGHPLPVVAHGPGTVILYAEGLDDCTVAPGAAYLPAQVVAFPAEAPFRARALEPDAGPLSHLANAIGRDARWVFTNTTPVLITPLNRPEPRATRMILHLLVHIAFWLLLVLMLRL